MKTTIIKTGIAIFFVLNLLSCGKKDDPQAIKDEISQYKSKIAGFEKKIQELESRLAEIQGEDADVFNAKVKVEEIKSQPFEHHILVNGTVEPVNQALISPEMNGQIEKIYVDEGQRVKKGQLLVQLNDDVIKNNIEEVKTGLELAKKLFEKQEKLWKQNIGSEVEFLQAKNQVESTEKRLESLKAQLKMTKISAPFSGIIDEISQKEGELATPGRQVLQLVNLNSLYINADLPEDYLGRIKEGDPVKISFNAYPELNFESRIIRTGNIIHPENRTFKIQLKIKNKDSKIKSNMLANLVMNDYSTDSAFLVPTLVIQQDVNGKYVYLANQENDKTISYKQYITLGRSNETHTIVKKGLKKGDRVIVQGYNLVKNGMEVEIITSTASL